MANEAKFTPGPWHVHVEVEQHGLYRGSRSVYVCSSAGWPEGQLARVSVQDDLEEREANAHLIAAATDLDAAAGIAITALSFEQENAISRQDPIAFAQITSAKNALIAAQNKARGREAIPEMLDITPARAAITRATTP